MGTPASAALPTSFRQGFADLIESILKEMAPPGADSRGLLPEGGALGLVEVPPDPTLGDLAFPCFPLARVLRRAPAQIAAEVAAIAGARLTQVPWLSAVRTAGGYVNAEVDPRAYLAAGVGRALVEGPDYGRPAPGSRPETAEPVVIDFSSPNIAKPFSIGHIRSTVIGHALARIFHFTGYQTVRINHLGDWGTQFGKLLVAYRLWADEPEVQRLLASDEPIKALLKIYVRFHEEAERRPELEDEARAWFKRLEDGDPDARRLWERFRDLSLAEFERIYRLLGIDFDEYSGESFYIDRTEPTLARLREAGLLSESQGALVVELSPADVGDSEKNGEIPPCLLRKSDGATLYATRDIAAALYRWERYQFAKLLYVVGVPQTLHFKQVFGVLRRLGASWVDRCHHIPFGTIHFAGESVSTRRGNVIFLEDVLKEAISRTRQIIEARNPTLANKDEVARQVGVGAVIFNDLRHNRIKDISFDWDEILNFDGDTGPYLQYTHARAMSVWRKGQAEGNGAASALNASAADGLRGAAEALTTPEEKAIVRLIERFPAVVGEAAEAFEPSVIARYALDVAKAYNSFYHAHRVLVDDRAVAGARLALTRAVAQVIANSLYLLGIEAPAAM